MSAIAKIWRNCIERGDQKYSNCPFRWRKEVLELMTQDVKDNVITAEQFKEFTGQEYTE